MKDSFIFHKEWRDAISGLPAEVRLEVYDAIIEYGISGTLAQLKPMAMLAFNFVKAAIDRDNERYDAICKRNRENGKNGGRPRKNPVGFQKTQNNPKNPVGFEEQEKGEKEIFPPAPPIKEKEKKEKESSALSCGARTKTMEERKADFYNSLVPYVQKYGKEMVRDFYDYWTEVDTRYHTKFRFEMEKTWGTPNRLATWYRKEKEIKSRYANNNGNTTAEGRAADAAAIVARLAATE